MNLQKLIRLDADMTAGLALVRSITDRTRAAYDARNQWHMRLRQLGEPDTTRRLRNGEFIEIPVEPSPAKRQALREIADLDKGIVALEAELSEAASAFAPLKTLHHRCLEFLRDRGIPSPVEIDPTAPRSPTVHQPGRLAGAREGDGGGTPNGDVGLLGAGTPADRRR